MIIALTPLLSSLGPVALLLVMAVVFAETGLLAGFFLPGDSLLFTTGILVAGGAFGLPLWVVALGVLAAAAAGDQVGYLLGRRLGPRLLGRPGSRWLRPEHAERAQEFFDRHGSRAVVLARFVPVVRTFTPVVAGVARMPRARFAAYNLLGAALWSVGVLSAGYFLGGVPVVAAHVELFAVGTVVASLVPAAAALGLRRWRSRRAGAAERPDAAERLDAPARSGGPKHAERAGRTSRSPRVGRAVQLLRYVGGVALAGVLLVVAVPALTGIAWAGTTAVVAAVPLAGLAGLAGLWLAGLLAHTITLTAALPSLTHRRALTLSLTGSAVANVLPLGGAAGVALNYRMLRDWGYDRPQFAAYTVVTNVWDVLAKLALPLLVLPVVLLTPALAMPHLAGATGLVAGLLGVAAAVVTAAMTSERAARAIGGRRLLETQRLCRQLVHERWARLTLGMALYTALLLALLTACLSLTGAGLPLAVVVVGFAVERLLTLAGITPGGAGVVELGLTGVLLALGGSAAAVVPGVLLYRALTFGLEIPVGGTALAGWLVLRHRARGRRVAAPVLAA